MRKLFVLLVVLMPLLAVAWPGPGTPAPDFTLPDTAYTNHSLSDYRGSVVLLNFWQSG